MVFVDSDRVGMSGGGFPGISGCQSKVLSGVQGGGPSRLPDCVAGGVVGSVGQAARPVV